MTSRWQADAERALGNDSIQRLAYSLIRGARRLFQESERKLDEFNHLSPYGPVTQLPFPLYFFV